MNVLKQVLNWFLDNQKPHLKDMSKVFNLLSSFQKESKSIHDEKLDDKEILSHIDSSSSSEAEDQAPRLIKRYN